MRTYHSFSAVLLVGTSLVLTALGGCAGFYIDRANGGVDAEASTGADRSSGVPGNESSFATGSAGSGNASDAQTSPPNDNRYSVYCGGDSAECTPGTSECTPGGNPNMSSGSGESLIACQLTALGGEVTATCNAVGTSHAGDPCRSVSHCAAGLGCANTKNVGICRRYCCDDAEACPSNTYCALQPMTEAPDDKIPVCAPVTNCTLLDNYGCAANEACTIVRKDGTTSCVTPGPGKRDEPCPCAAGYVCAPATNTCVKLCHTGKDDVDCAGGFCQGGVKLYPEGVGICVFLAGK